MKHKLSAALCIALIFCLCRTSVPAAAASEADFTACLLYTSRCV